jgi:peptidylprolyl isomerase
VAAVSELAEGCAPSGEVVESITVAGDFGARPEVNFTAPLEVTATQRAVVIEGDGELVENGDDVVVDYALFNATTGADIEDSGYDEFSPTVLRVDTVAPVFMGVSLTTVCSSVGSRVVGVIPAAEAFGPEGAPELGLEAGHGLVFVVDVISIKPPAVPPLDRIDGEASDPGEGFPSVEYGEVGAGDIVVVHYQGVNWNTGEVFDSSWSRNEAATFPTSGVIPGFRDGLIGQTVGSRVIIVIPPDLGYGPSGGTGDGAIGAEDTIVFVVDILGVQ